MDLGETIRVRCREIGLEVDAELHTRTTVRAPDCEPAADGAGDPTATLGSTLVSGGARTSSRELPYISVDLRGTLSSGDAPPTPDGPPRDLEVVRTLGEGGMGRVFLARQHSLDREVAVKTLRDRASERERRALVEEGAVTGHLEHPAIVPVHALGVDDHGRPVLVMKRVVGVPWSDQLDAIHAAGPPSPAVLDEHLAILVQVCHAVDFAHSRGVLHRDIKPQNVLVGAFGEVQVCDFGVALRLDRARDDLPMSGTPAYMAPEMVVGGTLDARSDVYLLGATLHHVLTGEPRHVRPTLRETLLAAAESRPHPYPAHVPAELAALADAACARDPDARPASAAAFRKGVVDHLRHRSSSALAAAAVERVAELRARADTPLADEAAQRDIDHLATEARVALRHALDEWPDNARAAAALAELDALLLARRARAAELARLAHQHDPMVSRPQRVGVTAGLTALALLLGALGLGRGVAGVTTKGLLLESLVPLGVAATLVAAFRGRLLRTVVNRRAAAGLLAVVAAITFDRALGLLAGLPPSTVLLADLAVSTVAIALAAALYERWFSLGLLVSVPAAVIAARAPERAVGAFSVVSAGVLLVVTLVLHGGRRAPTDR